MSIYKSTFRKIKAAQSHLKITMWISLLSKWLLLIKLFVDTYSLGFRIVCSTDFRWLRICNECYTENVVQWQLYDPHRSSQASRKNPLHLLTPHGATHRTSIGFDVIFRAAYFLLRINSIWSWKSAWKFMAWLSTRDCAIWCMRLRKHLMIA